MSLEKQELTTSLESREDENKKIGLIEKVSAAIILLLKHPQLAKSLHNLKSVCNSKDLSLGQGIYTGYTFSGKSGVLDIFGRKFDEISDISLFSKGTFLMHLNDIGLNFNANETAREKLHDVISHIIESSDISDDDLGRFRYAFNKSRQEGKKLIILGNHISHFDAPFLDYLLKKDVLDDDTKLRIVCGAFMYYNRNVRPFVKCFDTTFVFGPKDSRAMVKTIIEKESEYMDFFRKIGDKFESTLASHPKDEVSLLFPYAGRSDKKSNNFLVGCKDSIPKGMSSMLSLEKCNYICLGLNGPSQIFPSNPRGGGDVFKNLSELKKARVKMTFSDYFCGGEKNLQEIHDMMLETSRNAFRA